MDHDPADRTCLRLLHAGHDLNHRRLHVRDIIADRLIHPECCPPGFSSCLLKTGQARISKGRARRVAMVLVARPLRVRYSCTTKECCQR
jgi:hypothetical protein